MFAELNIFRTAHAMATHAGKRQSIVAQNIANADTPGYKPRDITPFSQLYSQASTFGRLHTGSLGARVALTEAREITSGAESPNGNAVSLELEMVKSVDAQRQHDQALAIYKSAMSILRTTLGRR